MKTLFLSVTTILFCAGCSSVFSVKSDPVGAEVFARNPKTGEKKPIGKTPVEMPTTEVRKIVGDEVMDGEFFTVLVEKQGFATQSFSVPATRFGTRVTSLDVKLKAGEVEREEKTAKSVLDHLFLAQKLALTSQYERAQSEIDKVLAEFPNFARALSMRASIYFAQKNYSESLKYYEEALKADPQLEDAVRMSAKVRAAAGGRLPASEKSSKP